MVSVWIAGDNAVDVQGLGCLVFAAVSSIIPTKLSRRPIMAYTRNLENM